MTVKWVMFFKQRACSNEGLFFFVVNLQVQEQSMYTPLYVAVNCVIIRTGMNCERLETLGFCQLLCAVPSLTKVFKT